MSNSNDSSNDFYARMRRQDRSVKDQEDLSDMYDEGKAIYISGVGYVSKRRKAFGNED